MAPSVVHAPASPHPTPGIAVVVGGSEAVAHVESRLAEVACVYPITPSTTMAAIYQAAVAGGRTDLSACMPEHGIADDAATRQARLAVESRAFPLYTYDPRRGDSIAERLSIQGNPALREDWPGAPDGAAIDFLTFARSEGRFAPHFAPDGTATPEILATRDDRVANWRMLQELAGLR